MDTEKFYFLNGELDQMTFSELSKEELIVAKHYVEITRHLKEINQIFLIFIFNIGCLQKQYVLMNSGDVFCNQNPADNNEDYIAINAYTTNIISAGRTLAESMECYIKENTFIDDSTRKQYLGIYHSVYDSSFAYRLLIRLRDFCQHGHLAVSSTQNNYYFDLKQIVEKTHYNHNSTLERQMKSVVDEIVSVYRDTPTLSYTRTMAEFVAELISLYKQFIELIDSEFRRACTNFENIVKAKPENIITGETIFNGLFIYDVEDGSAHTVHIEDNPQKMFDMFKEEAKLKYEEYSEALEQLIESTMWIRFVDKECIEIGIGKPNL